VLSCACVLGCNPQFYVQLRGCRLARRGTLLADAFALPAPLVSARELHQLMALLWRCEQVMRPSR